MRRAQAFSTVNWRKYLDVKTNPRAENFLKSKGDDVLWQMTCNIHNSMRNNLTELVLLVHPNVGGVIRIEQKEFKEVLELALDFFLKKEDYEKCSSIKEIISELASSKLKSNIGISKIKKLI